MKKKKMKMSKEEHGLKKMSWATQNKIWRNFSQHKDMLLGAGGQAHVYEHVNYSDLVIVLYDVNPWNNGDSKVEERKSQMIETYDQIIKGQNENKFTRIIRTFRQKKIKSLQTTTIGLIQQRAIYDLNKYSYVKTEQYSIMISVALGLQQLHEASIIHRDIKPSNILVVNDGNRNDFKIADLGFLKNIQEKPKQHTPIHSPNYSAPELYGGVHTDSVDIYSLGYVFIFLLFKQIVNFDEKELLNYIYDPDKEVQNNMRSLIQKMINQNPKERPQIDCVIKQLKECQEEQNATQEILQNRRNTQSPIIKEKLEKKPSNKAKEQIYENNNAIKNRSNSLPKRNLEKSEKKLSIDWTFKKQQDGNATQLFLHQQSNTNNVIDVRQNRRSSLQQKSQEKKLSNKAIIKKQEAYNAAQEFKNQQPKMGEIVDTRQNRRSSFLQSNEEKSEQKWSINSTLKKQEVYNATYQFQSQQQNKDYIIDDQTNRGNSISQWNEEKSEKKLSSKAKIKKQEEYMETQQFQHQQSKIDDPSDFQSNRRNSFSQRNENTLEKKLSIKAIIKQSIDYNAISQLQNQQQNTNDPMIVEPNRSKQNYQVNNVIKNHKMVGAFKKQEIQDDCIQKKIKKDF